MLFDYIRTLLDALKGNRTRISILSSTALKGSRNELVFDYILSHQFFFLDRRVTHSCLLYQENKHDSVEDDFDTWVYVKRVAYQMLLLNSAIIAINFFSDAFLQIEH